MEERELSERIRALSKAITAEPAPNVINMLNALKKDAAPTEEQLRSTKAGVVVGKLRSHTNRDIARVANEIVIKWRKNVDAAKNAKAQRTPKMDSPSSRNTSSGVGSPAPSAASSKPYEGDTSKRSFKVDKVDISRTGVQTRDNSIGLIYNGLAFRSKESIDAVLARSVEVEAATFKSYKGETNEYRSKLRSLFLNLKNRDNAQLGRRVMSGDITADRFVVMSDKELISAEQKAKDAAMEKENMMKAQVPMAEKSISDALECGKCKQKKVAYSQAQTRSADEPMTTFCECTVCGNRWKFS